MSQNLKKPWYAGSQPLLSKVDRWVSRNNPPSDAGPEADWLGWDGWVRTDGGPGILPDKTDIG